MATFWSAASVRIKNAPHLHNEIIEELGAGSVCHKKGEQKKPGSEARWPNDIWIQKAPVDENQEVHVHLEWVRQYLESHQAYFRTLLDRAVEIDVYCSYRCDEDHRGFGLSSEILSTIGRFGLRLEVSIMT